MNLMDVSANGVLFTAKYQVKDSVSVGKIDVSVEGKMYNSSGSEVAFTAVPGNVTIACKNHSFVKEVATEDACRIEHVISNESFEAIKNYVTKIGK